MKKYLKVTAYAFAGAVLGYAYYYYIGCLNGGACPLSSRWYITTLYGFISGIIIGLPSGKTGGKKTSVIKDENADNMR